MVSSGVQPVSRVINVSWSWTGSEGGLWTEVSTEACFLVSNISMMFVWHFKYLTFAVLHVQGSATGQDNRTERQAGKALC